MKKPGFEDSNPLYSREESTNIVSFLGKLLSLNQNDVRSLYKVIKVLNITGLDSSKTREERVSLLKGLRKHFVKLSMNEDPQIFNNSSKGARFFMVAKPKRRGLISTLFNIKGLKHPNSLIYFDREEREIHRDNFAQAILSVLGKTRDLNLVPSIDLKSIVEPVSEEILNNISLVNSEIRSTFSDLGIPNDDINYGENINIQPHGSSKRGPYGHASLTAIAEIYNYTEKEGNDIINLGKLFIPVYSKYKDISGIRQFSSIIGNEKIYKRRLSAIADYEGKTRIIAIGDGSSQVYLKPLHTRLMKTLKGIKSDITFKHERIHNIVKSYYNKSEEGDYKPSSTPLGRVKGKVRMRFAPYSIDLVTATDRIPVSISTTILEKLWGSVELSLAGEKLMSSWEFTTPYDRINGRVDVRYSIGQPMGLYSSGAALAVTNHTLVRLSALRLGLDKFEDYMVLGDDIVIFNNDVALEYIRLMESIGVSTKPVDSIKPKINHPLEIAKRLFRRGVEISPIPLNLMHTNLGLFVLYLMDRKINFPLVTLYPGIIERRVLKSVTAATLLMFWKICPPGKIEGEHGNPTSLVDALMFRPAQENKSFWGKVESSETLLLSHKVFNKGVATESYKLFNSYDLMSSGKSISKRKLNHRLMTNLPFSVRRTKIIDPAFRLNLEAFVSSNILDDSLKNSTAFKYVNNMHSYQSGNNVIDVTELYHDYSESIDEMRQGITVEINDVGLDSRDKVDNQMILGIEKAFEELTLSDDQLTELYDLCLTQTKIIESSI